MKILLTVLMLSLPGSGATVEAQIAYTNSSEYTIPNFAEQLSIPQFNPSLGQLQYLTITVTVSLVTSTVDPAFLQELCSENPGMQVSAPVDGTVGFSDGLGDHASVSDVQDTIYNCPGGGGGGGIAHENREQSATNTITVSPPQAEAYVGTGSISLAETGSSFTQAPGGPYDIIVLTEVEFFYVDQVFADSFE